MKTMLFNHWTTVCGFIAALANQLATVGGKWPDSGAEWMATILSAAIAAFGMVSKDASTGSKPSVD